MAKPLSLQDDKGKGKGTDEDESADFRHRDIVSGAEYADVLDEEDEDDDSEETGTKLDDDDDPDPETTFNGLESSAGEDVELRAEIKALKEQIESLRPSQTTKLRNMTKEQLDNLSKENPLALMTLMVEHVMETKGITGTSSDVRNAVNTQMDHSTAVQKARLAIATRFDPKGNPKLHKAAKQIYLQRKQRGITTDTDPRAELDAFIIAADENPELLSNDSRRGNPRKQASTARGGGESAPTLTREQREIAKNWGMDLGDKKATRRVAEISRRYNRLDNQRPRRGGR